MRTFTKRLTGYNLRLGFRHISLVRNTILSSDVHQAEYLTRFVTVLQDVGINQVPKHCLAGPRRLLRLLLGTRASIMLVIVVFSATALDQLLWVAWVKEQNSRRMTFLTHLLILKATVRHATNRSSNLATH